MKQKAKNIWTAFLGAILSLLGFHSCELIEPQCEYGTPNADYKYIGEVSDEEGNPIKGIRMIVAHSGFEDEYSMKDTLYTNANGKAETDYLNMFFYDTRRTIRFEDVDGSDNGGKFKTVDLTDKYLIQEQTGKGDGNWYGGKFTITAKAKLSKED